MDKSLRIALMDRCSLTMCGLSYFIRTLSAQNEIVLQRNSLTSIAEDLLYQQVDVLITELNGGKDVVSQGVSQLSSLNLCMPSLHIVVYTRIQSGSILRELADMPNVSIVSRFEPLTQLKGVFGQIFAGKQTYSPLIQASLQQGMVQATSAQLGTLTRRENEVLRYLFNGLTLGQIAVLQHRSIKTVSTHKCNAMRKLGAMNDFELFSLSKTITF
ncbi:LuxR C-terminal-related transcriptional regulator [Enterobacillus tribolii]|uniref:Two-component system capsular synthesis response regulator RcsB n=1 Tax=Enterobacillus tribolii TaxID=1487935 RepID=A0A370QQM9_9GAMM|nr:LuxR C-terminal-related transcriptional regulator [Enterobacillus tribolii]MBW7981701.1 response regulator transcription factor [Enterobacillus tribolii]RDK91080.1 two-component system capsular synthesis response regulator RcsB [Enterobacillus tribolii]